MKKEIKDPQEIERRSFEIIKSEISKEKFSQIPDEMKDVIVRIIHATADFEFLNLIKFSEDFFNIATNALKNKCNIITDIKMVKEGISKKGNIVENFIDDKETVALAKREGITRSMAAMRLYGHKADNGLIVIGNAPTALFEVINLFSNSKISPAAVIGVPVGFVGAKESKDALVAFGKLPYITSLGRKGGTPVAAAIVNALLKKLD